MDAPTDLFCRCAPIADDHRASDVADPAAGEPLLRAVIGEVLRAERRDQRRTLREIADSAGISLPYLSEIERGTKEASSEFIAALASALGLRLIDLTTKVQARLADPTTLAQLPPQRSTPQVLALAA